MGPTCGKEVRRYLKTTGGPVAKTNCSQGSLSQPKPLELSRAHDYPGKRAHLPTSLEASCRLAVLTNKIRAEMMGATSR